MRDIWRVPRGARREDFMRVPHYLISKDGHWAPSLENKDIVTYQNDIRLKQFTINHFDFKSLFDICTVYPCTNALVVVFLVNNPIKFTTTKTQLTNHFSFV